MGTLNLRLTEVEIKQLLDKYTEHSSLVNYYAFCDNINFVFSDLANQREYINGSRSTAIFTESEKQTLIQLLNAIRQEIKFQRILIKP